MLRTSMFLMAAKSILALLTALLLAGVNPAYAMAAVPPAGATDLQTSIFRVNSAEKGTAFVIKTAGHRLFLVTALHVLKPAEDAVFATGAESLCSIDHGSVDSAIPCKVLMSYPQVDLAVLQADSADFSGHPLALGASDNIDPDTKLKTCGYPAAVTHVQCDDGTYRGRVPPFAFAVNIAAEKGQSGSPLVDISTNRVVGIVLNQPVGAERQQAQKIEMVEAVLGGEVSFRDVIRLTTPAAQAPGALTQADYGPSLINAFENKAAVDDWYKRARRYQRTDTEGPWLGDEDGWLGMQRVYISSRREDTGLGRGWIHGFQYKVDVANSDLCSIKVTNSDGVRVEFNSLQQCDTIKSTLAARVERKDQLDAKLDAILADDQLATVLPTQGPSYVGADLQVARAQFVPHGFQISTGSITYTFDAKGLLRNVKKKKFNVDLIYDSQSRLITAQDPLRSMHFEYTGEHLAAVSFNDGSRYVYGYSAAGDLASVSFNGKVIRSYEYDEKHRLIHFKDAALPEAERHITYSEGNTLSSVKLHDTTYQWTFDEDDDQKISTVDQKLSDPGGELITHRVFTFSGVDRTLKMVEDGDATTYELTICLCLPLKVTNNGRVSTFQYDQYGRLIKTVTPLETTELEYDESVSKASKVTRTLRSGTVLWSSFTYRPDGLLAGAQNNEKQQVSLAYFADGTISNLTDGEGKTISFVYNSKGKPVSISAKAGTVKFTYKPNGEVDQINSDGGANIATDVMHFLQSLIDITSPASSGQPDTNYTKVTHIPGDGNLLCQSCDAKGN